MGAQQQHKGMFLKHGAGGAKIFQQCHGGGTIFFCLSISPNHPSPPPLAINNERSLCQKYLRRSPSDDVFCGVPDCAGIRSFITVPYYNDVVHNEISELQIYVFRLYFINLY